MYTLSHIKNIVGIIALGICTWGISSVSAIDFPAHISISNPYIRNGENLELTKITEPGIDTTMYYDPNYPDIYYNLDFHDSRGGYYITGRLDAASGRGVFTANGFAKNIDEMLKSFDAETKDGSDYMNNLNICENTYASCREGCVSAHNSCYASLSRGVTLPSFDACPADVCLENCAAAYTTCKENVQNALGKKATQISESHIGSPANLPVPVRAQRECANGEAGSTYCGPASLGMVIDYLGGQSLTTKEIADSIFNNRSISLQDSVRPGEIVALAKSLGYEHSYLASGKLFGVPLAGTASSMAFLKYNLEDKTPVIVSLKMPSGYGHAMVLIGMTDTEVVLNDPWLGTQVSYGRAQFKEMWDGAYNDAVIIKK